jgi:hypothetical protein
MEPQMNTDKIKPVIFQRLVGGGLYVLPTRRRE